MLIDLIKFFSDLSPGPQARKLLVDAQVMLERLVVELEGRAVVGMFDCRSDGDDVIVNDLTSTETLYMLRQQVLYTLLYNIAGTVHCLVAKHI